jgi:uncharacterized RDD family membrane protein YckC
MQNPPPPPPSGGYPPPPPPSGGYPPPPPPSGGYPPPPPPSGGYPPPPPPSGGYPPPPPPSGGYTPPPPPPQPAGYPAPQGYGYAPQTTYGGFWIRFVAVLIDGVIVGIPIVIVAVIIGVATGIAIGVSGNTSQQATSAASASVILLLRLIAFVFTVGYFVYFWGSGSTLGMRLFHLRVADATTGAPIGYTRAAVRYLGYVVSALVCYIGLIWAAFDGRKQGWHDKMANSVVLQG